LFYNGYVFNNIMFFILIFFDQVFISTVQNRIKLL